MDLNKYVRPVVVLLFALTLCAKVLIWGDLKDAFIGITGTAVGYYFRGRDSAKKGEGS